METNSIEEEKISMKKHRISNDEQSLSNTDINDPENLDYDEDHLTDQPKHFENNFPPAAAAIVASDDGELDEIDLEDGEIHDPTASKSKSIDENPDATSTEKSHCRYFLQGRCHWGSNCKYIHPTNEINKGLSSIVETLSTNKTDSSPPTPTNNWISPSANSMNSHFFPNPMIRGPAPISVMPIGSVPGPESAWERGLRSAKTLREQSMRRKQQDKDFNEKKFNLTLRDAMDEKDVDEHQTNVDPKSSIDHDLDDVPLGSYADRYHSYSYSNSRYSNRRSDPRDDFVENRHYRKDVTSNKTKSRKDENPSYRRNSSQTQYPTGSHDETSRSTSYHNRRPDDWHDPWERSKNHGNRRSSRTDRERSYTSSSRSSSSSSRSSRSRSRSSSSSSRSRSRSRSRVKRRSSSVTRAAAGKTSNETVKNGNEKKANGNKKVSSPTTTTTTTTKFLPGRQISSHTLKKAAKSSNNNHSSNHSHSTETRGKDSEKKSKKNSKKNVDRSDSSSSSSSSSDSDDQRKKRRSPSSSSSDSSTSENESRKAKETKTKKISGGTKKETTNKKRRETSSSTGSTSRTKKSKLIVDSHPSSTEPINAESSDSNKKKR